jgi:hypothetical protein
VSLCEYSLPDGVVNSDDVNPQIPAGLLKEPAEGEETVETRVLKGCVRVGDLANGLLLKGDKSLEMLVFCTDKPTVYMLQNVKEKFEELLTVSPALISI